MCLNASTVRSHLRHEAVPFGSFSEATYGYAHHPRVAQAVRLEFRIGRARNSSTQLPVRRSQHLYQLQLHIHVGLKPVCQSQCLTRRRSGCGQCQRSIGSGATLQNRPHSTHDWKSESDGTPLCSSHNHPTTRSSTVSVSPKGFNRRLAARRIYFNETFCCLEIDSQANDRSSVQLVRLCICTLCAALPKTGATAQRAGRCARSRVCTVV